MAKKRPAHTICDHISFVTPKPRKPEQTAEVVLLKQKGWSYEQIALQLSVKRDAVIKLYKRATSLKPTGKPIRTVIFNHTDDTVTFVDHRTGDVIVTDPTTGSVRTFPS